VLVLPQFATVTKHPAADWDLLVPAIESILSSHLDGR
jgi:Scaffold protein Nfu/NifU N terminal